MTIITGTYVIGFDGAAATLTERYAGEVREAEAANLDEIFSDRMLRETLRIRGGTALSKLHFPVAVAC